MVGISIPLLGASATLQADISFGGQQFSTLPVPNNRAALYSFSIREPGGSFGSYANYTFPLSPGQLSKRFTSMTNIFDISGDSGNSIAGVQRIADDYGNAPPMWSIEGTTGWKRHATDGYGLTGIESAVAVQQFFTLLAQLNAQQAQNNQPPFTLEFYDYFAGDYWQVVLVGNQEIRQNRNKPILMDYSFHFAGIQPVGTPLDFGIDGVLGLLATPAAQALSNVASYVGGFISGYADETLGSDELSDVG